MRGRTTREILRGAGATLQKLAAVAFGAGCCLSIWVYGKGNQEILALPLAFWISVQFWPEPASASQGNRMPREGAWRRGLLWTGVAASWIVAIVGLFLPDATPAHPGLTAVAAESDLALAEGCYQRGEFDKALALLDRLSVPAGLPKIAARRAHDRGLALLRLRRNLEAFDSFSQSLTLDPQNVEAACLLSEIALANGDRSTARLYLDKAKAVDPSYDSVLRLSVRLSAGGGDRPPKRGH